MLKKKEIKKNYIQFVQIRNSAEQYKYKCIHNHIKIRTINRAVRAIIVSTLYFKEDNVEASFTLPGTELHTFRPISLSKCSFQRRLC